MKKLFLKSGFEVIFSFGLMIILALPAIVAAQDHRDIDITIQNGDTTVNGKKLKDLSPDERQAALDDISRLNANNGDRHGKVLMFRRNFNGGDMTAGSRPMGLRDSAGHQLHIARRFNGDLQDNGPQFNFRGRSFDQGMGFGGPRERMFTFSRRNTQTFNYTNTGADGISTHVNFRVSNEINDDDQEDTKAEKNELEAVDLNLVPEFSTGKTLLMFSLPAKGAAEVSLTDSEGKQLWSEKTVSGNFSKSFVFPLNGIYHLHVKQGGKTLTKRIVKN